MVHSFTCLGRSFVLDTESGTLLEVDSTAKRIIEQKILPLKQAGDFFGCKKQDKPLAKDKCLSNNCSKLINDNSADALNKAATDNLDRTEENEIVDPRLQNEAEEEINLLIKQGLLFAPQPQPVKPVYSGVVKSLCLNVSHNCNLRCKYCFADGGSYNTKRHNMSFKVAKAAIDFLIARSGNRKNLEVDFFGGEPLLNMDVVRQTVDYARSLQAKTGKNFRFTITTNGVLLTNELIEYFNKEMHNVVVSIDGREDVHNLVRPDACGKSTFTQSLDAARQLKQKRGDRFYYIRGTFTSQNKDFAQDALALNDYGFDQISLEPVVLDELHPLALKKEDLPMLKQQYELLAGEYIQRRKGDKWFNFFHFMMDLEGGPCLKKRITGCGAGTEYLAVSPDGGIYPCHRFDGKDEYLIGNVLDGSFNETLPKMFAASNVYTKEKCADCFSKYYCSGGCAANSIEYGGGINGNYEIGCELMRKRTEAALAIYAIERDGKQCGGCDNQCNGCDGNQCENHCNDNRCDQRNDNNCNSSCDKTVT